MTLTDVLSGLKAAQELLTHTVPDGMEQAAGAADKIAGALRDAAAFLRTLDGSSLLMGTGPECAGDCDKVVCELRKLQDECIAACVKSEDCTDAVKAAALPSPLRAVLLQLIAEAIQAILTRAVTK